MNKDEKVVNEYINENLNKVAQKLGRTRQEVYERMKRGDESFKAQVNQELTKQIAATTNSEVREAAQRLKK